MSVLVHDIFPLVWPGVWLAGIVVFAWGAGRWGRWSALPLAACSLLWLVSNAPAEGGTLLSFSRNHGLTVTDLAGIAGLALAGWTLLRGR